MLRSNKKTGRLLAIVGLLAMMPMTSYAVEGLGELGAKRAPANQAEASTAKSAADQNKSAMTELSQGTTNVDDLRLRDVIQLQNKALYYQAKAVAEKAEQAYKEASGTLPLPSKSDKTPASSGVPSLPRIITPASKVRLVGITKRDNEMVALLRNKSGKLMSVREGDYGLGGYRVAKITSHTVVMYGKHGSKTLSF